MKIGVIGLGNLGEPLAYKLLKAGYDMTVHDLEQARAQDLLDHGAHWANSPQAVAKQVDTVITVLPSPAAVATVVEGETGILSTIRPGSTWMDVSTTDWRESKRLAARFAEKGVGMLETPMTGGITLFHQNIMTILVGAEKEVFEKHQSLLQTLSQNIIHLGPVGSANVTKVLTNMMAAIHLWALGEGLALGASAGLEIGPLFEAIKMSCANSFVAETEGVEILNGTYDFGFTFGLQAKDAHLAYELGRELGVPLEMASLVEQLMARAIRKYGPDEWSTGLVRLLEDDIGIEFRAPGYETTGSKREQEA
ncbi:MAG: NAD(P)-dependent oxidoreductase [Chloroflexota bacterium]